MAKEGKKVHDDFDRDTDLPLGHKRAKSSTTISKEGEDRLSELPDSLILYILSLCRNDDEYDVKEVIRTCLLSKRWQFLWTNMSEVDLYESDIDKISSFVNWVGRMLDMCSLIHLNKFSVEFSYDECFASNVNLWVQIAVTRNVKDIALNCFGIKATYELPQMLYTHSSLTSLTIVCCAMTPRETIDWQSLKSLSIDHVKLSDCVMERILSGCPVLEALHLKSCSGLSRLNICCPTLTILKIKVWHVYDGETYVIDISAPYVRELTITGYVERTQFRLRDISSLVQASLNFYGHKTSPSTMNYMIQLLQSLQHVKELELGHWCVETLSMLELEGLKIPSSTRCCLTLNALRHKGSIPGILCILKSSPYLETLVINGRCNSKIVSRNLAATYLQSGNFDLVFHLKTIKFNHFISSNHDGEPMTTLAQILLKSASVLEKMVISSKELSSYISKGLPEISKRVLAFPRASPAAVVVVY